MDYPQIWGLRELIFWSILRLLELKFDEILGFRTEPFPNFEALECKIFQIFVISRERRALKD